MASRQINITNGSKICEFCSCRCYLYLTTNSSNTVLVACSIQANWSIDFSRSLYIIHIFYLGHLRSTHHKSTSPLLLTVRTVAMDADALEGALFFEMLSSPRKKSEKDCRPGSEEEGDPRLRSSSVSSWRPGKLDGLIQSLSLLIPNDPYENAN